MWFLLAFIHVFLLALVNYTDEHLATSNKLPPNGNVHSKVGSVLIMSTLMSFVGASIIFFITKNLTITNYALFISMLSAIPLVATFAAYFYMLQTYPVHQISPVFQLSAVWLLIFDLLLGSSITTTSLLGILVLIYGAYILDTGTFKWVIPTKFLVTAIPATSFFAISLMMVKVASNYTDPLTISFYQLIGIGLIGIILFLIIPKYKEAFLYRIKNQGKKFLGLSLANETFAEAGYAIGNMAVVAAPVAAFIPAMSGVQSLIVLLLFYFFPHGKRSAISNMQWIAVSFIAIGVLLLNI